MDVDPIDIRRSRPGDDAFAGAKLRDDLPLLGRQTHRFADRLAVVLGNQPVGDLQIGVLDRIGNQAGRDLVHQEQPFAVGPDLGEHVGEELQDQRHEEGLVAVVAHVGEIDDTRTLEKRFPGCGMQRIEHFTLPSPHQRIDARIQTGLHVAFDALLVMTVGNDPVDTQAHAVERRRNGLPECGTLLQPVRRGVLIDRVDEVLHQNRQDIIHREGRGKGRFQPVDVCQHVRGLPLGEPYDLERVDLQRILRIKSFRMAAALEMAASGDIEGDRSVGMRAVVVQRPVDIFRLGGFDHQKRQLPGQRVQQGLHGIGLAAAVMSCKQRNTGNIQGRTPLSPHYS